METSLIFEILGIAGSLILCISAIPQIVKTYRTKSSGDLSILYLITLMFGLALLMVYSIYVRDFVFIFGNTLAILSTGGMIFLWFKYRKSCLPAAKE
ncbi:SemiSWEET family sugar transporter [Thermodesulfobacteriota bacterium]